MNFEDERYVRLYVRDTPTWLSWPWEARAVLPSLLRKVDRGGRIEWPPKLDAAKAIAAAVAMPERVVKIALVAMVDSDTITVGSGWLEMPNFVPGQNSKSRAKTGAERTAECRAKKAEKAPAATRCDDALHRVTKSDECNPQPSSAQLSPMSIDPFGVSPPNSAGAEPGGGDGGGQVLTHPTADPSAGTVASQRKRAAAELWAWHEGERTRRLLAGQHQPRQATDKFLAPVLRLQAHVRKAYDCDEAEAWRRVREYREARLDETERGLREGHPEAAKWRGWAAGEAAWSSKGFDYLGEREPDARAAKAAADAEYQAEVRRLKDLRRKQGGGT